MSHYCDIYSFLSNFLDNILWFNAEFTGIIRRVITDDTGVSLEEHYMAIGNYMGQIVMRFIGMQAY